MLGSGPSLNYLDPQFFRDKLVVSTNYAAETLGVMADYAFTHYHRVAKELQGIMTTVVTLERDTVTQQAWGYDDFENIAFAKQDSYQAPGSAWNPLTTHRPKQGSLAYGSSSLHGAMHLAAHLGASSIVLVGADCGTIDDAHRVDGYPVDGHKPWALYNQHHKLMKDWLAAEYGVNVYSLNPFINLNLEGHRFDGV